MPARTDFNVSPYWDTFAPDNDFYRVLFRPGFAVQARELTTLQTILQNQIEQLGNHFFKEGTIVIPGSVAYDSQYYAVKFQATFSDVAVSTYLDQYVGNLITGVTSGITAEVIGYDVAVTDGDPDTLYVKYISSNTTDNATRAFADDEEISANVAISSYLPNIASAQLAASDATATGSAANVTAGIFYVRGFMTRTTAQTITLDKYTNTPSYRIGFNITESLITPEEDPDLLDNAAGSSNYAAKGAHRFKMTLTLTKKTLTTSDDSNFIELARVEDGVIIKRKKATEYSIVADMLARRTFDESGDYVVNHFDIEPRENLNDGTNRGIYTAAQGGDETKDVLVISAGKAYVQGYEVEKQSATFLNIDKARTTKSVNNDNVPFNLGNYAKVDNVYSQPDVSLVSPQLLPYGIVQLYDKQTVPAGSGVGPGYSSGTQVGLARSRAFEYGSGTVAATSAIYHNYLFDISMFTKIVTTSVGPTLSYKARITGATSGATGIVADVNGVAGTTFYLMQVEGAFQTGETITSSVVANTPGAGTLTTILSYDYNSYVKQIYGDNTTIDYTADVILDQTLTLTGEVTTTASGTAVAGTNTKFLTELVVGDVIRLPTGSGGISEEFRVSAIADNLGLTVEKTGSGTASTTAAKVGVSAIRLRTKIAEEEEIVLVYKMPKENVASLLTDGVTDTTYTFRKQYYGTTASGAVSFTALTGETFYSASAGRDYTLTVVGTGTGSYAAGKILDLSSTKAGTTSVTFSSPAQTITITDTTLLGNGAAVTLTASVTTPEKLQKSKTANKMTTKTIAAALLSTYGERVSDKTINLSYADVYKLHAVYESAAIGTPPVTPTLTIADSTGTFTVGEIITGSSSGATGRVIINDSATNINYVILTGTITTNDTITGGTSGYTATVSATTLGDRNVSASFLLDTGQRDSFYDLGRVTRKPNAVTPTGQLTFVYDYFSHGSGDYFSVDSYTGQIDYEDIPAYSASKVDPGSKAPIGFYELRDSLDFRPSVQNQTAPTTDPFAFPNKNFSPTGDAGNLVIPDANVRSDFTFYLPRRDLLYLDTKGRFILVKGIPAEDAVWPMTDNMSMLMARVTINPYTFIADRDIQIGFQYTRRYTMADIGKLHTRVGALEYAQALGLLERQTDSTQLFDENGFNRFKSGFVVDTFYGHNKGNPLNRDYEVSVDPQTGHLRPLSFISMTKLEEENTTDAERAADNYAKTGDLITLAYTHTAQTTQPYASRVESVNPFSVTSWIGDLTLEPNSDFWIDTQRAAALVINIEGNYDQMLTEEFGGNANPDTIWGSWNTLVTGATSTTAGSRRMERNPNASQEWGDWIRWVTTEASTTTNLLQNRTGVNTRLVERISVESQGDRVINVEVVPWIRPSQVQFTATGMKPNTRIYAFFDRVDVNAEVKPRLTSAVNTLLNGALTKTATTVTVDSTTGFPSTGTIGVGAIDAESASGISFVAQEQMTYTGVTATTFTGITRNTGQMFAEPQVWADNTYVSNQTYGTALVTDNIGTLYGRFSIPTSESKRFRVGTRTFRLTDSSTNSLITGIVETAAEATYTASGMMQTVQEEIWSVRNAESVTQTLTSDSVWNTETSGGGQTVGDWYDPLAQTIMCDQPNGMFITKLDVFFAAKDDTLPVWCEVRNVVNGYPGQTIFPFSKITKAPADVNIDATLATTATTFTFDSPIYVQRSQEIAVVIASNSPKYKVWICQLGELEVGGTRTISAQPTLGSLFKSQNASTWSASQFEDLKFTLYRANFETANAGNFTVVNEELKTRDPDTLTALDKPIRLGGGKDAGIPTLDLDPIDTSSTLPVGGNAGKRVRVRFRNHGMYATNNSVTITGVESDIGSSLLAQSLAAGYTGSVNVDDTSNWPGTGYVKIDDEIIYYSANGNTNITIPGSGGRAQGGTAAADHEDNSIVALYMIGGIPLTEINKAHTSISGIETDSFLLTTTTAATAAVTGGGPGVQCTGNITFDLMHPLVHVMELPDTEVTAKAQTTTGSSVSGSQTPFALTGSTDAYDVALNEDTYYDAPNIITSKVNETAHLSGNKSFRLTTSMTTIDSAVSPVIDTSRMGLITAANRLNEIDAVGDIGSLTPYHAMTASNGDNNNGIYITKKITLAQSATAIQVLFDGVVQNEADIRVLYKTLRTDSAETFNDIDWIFFNSDGSPDTAVPISKTRGDFKEYKYLAGKNALGSGTELSEFIAFAVKIVLQGTNSSLPPLLKDFRTIAYQP